MDNLYKDLFKENNKKIKSLNGEYKLNLEEIVKSLRLYAAKIQSTEKVVEEIILEFTENYNKNIRFTTFINNKQDYLDSKKSKCIKGNPKPKFNTKQKIGIIVFVVLMLGFTAFGIYMRLPVRFDVPENIIVNESMLSFDKVEYAKKYQITITDVNNNHICDKQINANSFDLSTLVEITNEGTYIIRVKVLGNGAYNDSPWSCPVTYVYTE